MTVCSRSRCAASIHTPIAGGTDALISPFVVACFPALRALSVRNDAPAETSRPFDKDRDGFVLGEGAGILVLEEVEHAQRRGYHIYAELAGYGTAADAHTRRRPRQTGTRER